MSYADSGRAYVEESIKLLEDAQNIQQELQYKLELIRSNAERWGSDSNAVTGIIAASHANENDLRNLKSRNGLIRDMLEEWWRAL